MDIEKFQQFQKTGVKLGKNVIGIMRSFGFTFSAGFFHHNKLKDFNYVVLFFNPENGGSVGFAFTNNNEARGRFKITHSESRSSASVTCRSFFFNYDLGIKIEQIAGRYKPQEIEHPMFGKMYYIKLNEKLTS